VGGSTSTKSATNSDGSAKDPYKIVKATYSLNGSNLPTCNKPAYISVSRDIGIGIVSCDWLFGEYKGKKPISVSLSFEQNEKGDIWYFDSELISTPLTECHD